ncbi:glycosyltransferase [Desulfogranum japonicum]|uniref:glycosyltransferase n=1 Tax=Desulfogranum japonicum TaxID=231447 RepID=UPI000424C993|nr:glycosyltransferase [Desulfogranum japonicum]
MGDKSDLRVALVHYHLQKGGVTRIIEHCVNSLVNASVSVVVVTGKAPDIPFPCKTVVVPGLQYELHRPKVSSDILADEMVRAASAALGGPPDIWHTHNHSLGKNLALPGALCKLAEEGYPLLLHIHDFAEDGRPGNYRAMLAEIGSGRVANLSASLYPWSDHIHYAVLNTRDYCYLQAAGADEAHIHLLANPVHIDARCCDEDISPCSDVSLWVYPTRAIRRKNIGEFLLWATVAEKGNSFATTLGPENPTERTRYEKWVKIARELDLPVEFEKGVLEGCPFYDVLRQSRGLVTTSVAEGFGMAFLEPWLVDRPVYGRNLAEITYEFVEKGLELPHVYHRLDVPLEWIGKKELHAAAWKGLTQYMAAYGRSPGKEDCQRTLAAWVHNDCVDFGRLDELLQEQIIRHLAASPQDCSQLLPEKLTPEPCKSQIVVKNRDVILDKFSLESYGKQLYCLYSELAGTAPGRIECLDGRVLLEDFLAPERLHLLRVD